MGWLADYWWILLIFLLGTIINAIKELSRLDHRAYLKPLDETPAEKTTPTTPILPGSMSATSVTATSVPATPTPATPTPPTAEKPASIPPNIPPNIPLKSTPPEPEEQTKL